MSKTNGKTSDSVDVTGDVLSLSAGMVTQLRDLLAGCQAADANVDDAKASLAEAKKDAEAAHKALTDYIREVTDPDYMPLLRRTVDRATGELRR